MSDYLPLPKKPYRITGQKYMYKNQIVIWNGKKFLCEHRKERNKCILCGGASICEHNRRRNTCLECRGGSTCDHGRQRNTCLECKGSQICDHGRIRSFCKECGGGGICEHGKQRSQCKECGGNSFCEHGIRKDRCKECGGNSFCKHNKRKEFCKECGGSQICAHGRIRSVCKECGGGGICEHRKQRSQCKECSVISFCEHGIRKYRCKLCNPNGYLIERIRTRVFIALRNYSTRKDKKHTFEYVGSLEVIRTHLENQFENEAERCGHPISWENQGEWHIDHIRPCASFDLDLEDERHKCFHYTNLQPMWGPDNISKSDTYNEDDDEREWDGDKWN